MTRFTDFEVLATHRFSRDAARLSLRYAPTTFYSLGTPPGVVNPNGYSGLNEGHMITIHHKVQAAGRSEYWCNADFGGNYHTAERRVAWVDNRELYRSSSAGTVQARAITANDIDSGMVWILGLVNGGRPECGASARITATSTAISTPGHIRYKSAWARPFVGRGYITMEAHVSQFAGGEFPPKRWPRRDVPAANVEYTVTCTVAPTQLSLQVTPSVLDFRNVPTGAGRGQRIETLTIESTWGGMGTVAFDIPPAATLRGADVYVLGEQRQPLPRTVRHNFDNTLSLYVMLDAQNATPGQIEGRMAVTVTMD